MNARLGFSIAANLNPDVLVIDEVLAVGDMAFQQRCINRMEQFKRDGVAIVFVSHNLQAVASLCDEAVFMAGGLEARGRADGVVRADGGEDEGTSAGGGPATLRSPGRTHYDAHR